MTTTTGEIRRWLHVKHGIITGIIVQDDRTPWIDIKLVGDHDLKGSRGRRLHYKDGERLTVLKARLQELTPSGGLAS